jgi:hypothetical protein
MIYESDDDVIFIVEIECFWAEREVCSSLDGHSTRLRGAFQVVEKISIGHIHKNKH